MTRGFRLGQLGSGGLLALAHGTNDAQKTMGVITLALIANGNLKPDAAPPAWVVVAAATAIALGTYTGGWRIIRTMGSRIIKMDAAQGFSAQGAGAATAGSRTGLPSPPRHEHHRRGEQLLEATGASIGGAIGLSVAVSLLIRGAARSAEHRRAGNGAAAAANTAVALLALVVCLGAVVAAIVVMTAK